MQQTIHTNYEQQNYEFPEIYVLELELENGVLTGESDTVSNKRVSIPVEGTVW